MDILKKIKAHAEQVEVVSLQNEATSVEFEANKLKTSKVEETKGIAVRVVRDGKLGFAASSDDTAMDKLAANALESAAYGDPVALIFPSAQPTVKVATYDPKIAELPIPRLVEIGNEIIALILNAAPEVRVNVSLKRGVQQLSIRNQSGAEIDFSRSPLSIGVEIDRIEGDDVLIMYDVLGVTLWNDNYLEFVQRLVEKLKLARNITSLRSGRMPVLFSPSGGLVLGIPLMQGINGKSVYTGISPLRGRVGEKLFDEKITLVDDGTLDGGLESAPYDDEGVPHRRNVIIDKGVLKGFLYDLKTAVMSGVESTGNGSRSLFSPPSPGTTNLIIEPGNTPLSEMIASIDYGILVEDVLGMGQGNVISGAFSNPLSVAFKIEKGEIVGRIKNASIADNVYTLLKNVSAVSQEQDWVYGSLCLPYILLPEMNIIAKE
jgi:PmbA protein